MKTGWKIKPMGEVGVFQRGGGFLKSDFVENGFPCIHYGQIHMKLGATTYSHLTCIPASVAAKSKIASTGDVIIAITSEDVAGSCKSTAWMGNYDVAIGAHAAIFKHNLNPLFVSYYIQSCYFQSAKEAYTHGFKVVEIKPSDIAKIPIRFPSLPEQQRIVDVLDHEYAKIDALKANAEKSLQAAKDLFQATLKKKLEPKEGWEMKRITEIASLKAGKFVSAQDIFDERGEGLYPCFGGNGLRGYVKTYNHEGRFNIIGRQGALCGNINIADGKFHATEHAVVVSPIVPVIFKFLYYSLCNANINQYATGAAQPGISVKNINERLFLAIPSLAEQKRVANQLDQIKQQTDTLQDNYQKTLSLCDDLKQSLLRKAFNGEL